MTKSGYLELEACRAEARGAESGGEVLGRGSRLRGYDERCKLPSESGLGLQSPEGFTLFKCSG